MKAPGGGEVQDMSCQTLSLGCNSPHLQGFQHLLPTEMLVEWCGMSHINIEIKARCRDQERIRNLLRQQGADFRGTDHQIDTYFLVSQGRLKLREGSIENALVYYERSDQAGPKQSDVVLMKNERSSSLKEILTRSIGIRVVVDKVREIYFIENVKFHLDAVDQLGLFVEIEAIDFDGTVGVQKLTQQCQIYLDLFGIHMEDLLSESYSDMLIREVS